MFDFLQCRESNGPDSWRDTCPQLWGDVRSFAENNIRQDFTPVEKVEIARRIEEAMAGRHGGDRKSSCDTLQVEDTGNSRDIAAEAVGWLDT